MTDILTNVCAAHAEACMHATPVRLYLTTEDLGRLHEEVDGIDLKTCLRFMGMPISEAHAGTKSRIIDETGKAWQV